MASTLEAIDDLNFEAEVLGSKLPFLLDFSASWCAPCRALSPILETLAVEQRGKLRIGKIDLDESPGVAARLGVRGVPTLLLFSEGQERARKLGLANRKALLAMIGEPDSPRVAV